MTEKDARRPYRSPLFPVPQILGIIALVIAALNVFPVPEIETNIYKNFGWFLAVSIVFSLIYNGVTYKGAMFKRVPLSEVYQETDRIAEVMPEAHEEGRG